MLGGGMRQAGILAAAGLIALHKMSLRLEEDHNNAKLLADHLSGFPFIKSVRQATNMVFFDLSKDAKLHPAELPPTLREKGIFIGAPSGQTFRLVVHYYISQESVHKVLAAFKELLG